ncbi:hypothetical protein ZWY2020_048549 [Hordeum vulgare]|nr:hypothetical protein ZWY2020_048549 [Hordeum vulgare]
MGSSPSNHVPSHDENSLSHPPRKESQYMLADKVVDQWDNSDTENSSGSASYEVVPYKSAQGENIFLVPPKKRKFTIDTYFVECSTCQKWRIIPSKLKYEQIRENIIQVPFSCKYVHGWKPLSQFSFKVPKPPNRPRQSKLIEPTKVPPPVHRDPVHNYMPVPHGEANPLTHIPVTVALQVPVIRSKKRKPNQ